MAANEQSEHKTCTDTAVWWLPLSLQDHLSSEQKPPNSSQRAAETASRASQMDAEQHARAQADTAKRLSAVYLRGGTGLITQHMQTLRGSLEGRQVLISAVKTAAMLEGFNVARMRAAASARLCVCQAKASSRCTYKAWRALTTLYNSDISL